MRLYHIFVAHSSYSYGYSKVLVIKIIAKTTDKIIKCKIKVHKINYRMTSHKLLNIMYYKNNVKTGSYVDKRGSISVMTSLALGLSSFLTLKHLWMRDSNGWW